MSATSPSLLAMTISRSPYAIRILQLPQRREHQWAERLQLFPLLPPLNPLASSSRS